MKKLLIIIAALGLVAFSGSYATWQEKAFKDQCWWVANDGGKPWEWMAKQQNGDNIQWTILKSKASDAYFANKDTIWRELLDLSNGCIFPKLREKMGTTNWQWGNLESQVNRAAYPKISDFYIWLNQLNGNQVAGQGNQMGFSDFNNNFHPKLAAAAGEYPEILKDICQCMHDKIKARLG